MSENIKLNQEEASHELRYKEIAQKTFELELVQNIIGEMYGNTTQDRDTAVPDDVLEVFREINFLIVKNTLVRASYNINNIGKPDWKSEFADAISTSIYDYYKKDDEFRTKVAKLNEVLKAHVKRPENSGLVDAGLDLGMPKITSAIAQSSFLIEAQINPDVILFTDEEANEDMAEFHRQLEERGAQTIITDPQSDPDELIEKLKSPNKPKDTLH